MMKIPLPENEDARLNALYRYNILDTPSEKAFDELARLAAYICRTPIALIAFLNADREWSKSRVGLHISEIPRNASFSAHVILQPDKVLIVSDALVDERFQTNPLVVSDPKIRFYAGVPLVTSEGYAIGALCVMDYAPRSLSLEQIESLSSLSQQVMMQLELRRNLAEMSHAIAEYSKLKESLQISETHYRSLYEDNPSMYFTVDADGKILSVNKFGAEELGYATEELIGQPMLNFFHQEDKRIFSKQLSSCLRNVGQVSYWEFRMIRKDGSTLWVKEAIRSVRNAENNSIVLIACEDITRYKELEKTLHQTQEELKMWSKERADELQRVNEELKKEVLERKRVEEEQQQANEKLTRCVTDLEQRNGKIVLLNELGDLLQAGLTTEEAYTVITNYAKKIFPGDAGALYILNYSINLLEAVAVWGDPLPSERVFTASKCWALRRGRPHVVESLHSEPLCQHFTDSIEGGYICVPMMAQGRAIGILYLHSKSKGLSQSEGERLKESAKQQLVVTMAEHVALALANLRLREALRDQAIYDPLTGLFNRRYMEETLKRELSRSKRKQGSLGIIMIDIDHFKRFNDEFGHASGDSLLRDLGLFIQTHIRREDIACRYGGEEFTLILPEASLDQTYHRAEQLREEVKTLRMYHRDRLLGPITLSMGVAGFPEHGSTVDSLLETADSALYFAKIEGRDRVAIGKANK